jgi:hypothetical protein
MLKEARILLVVPIGGQITDRKGRIIEFKDDHGKKHRIDVGTDLGKVKIMHPSSVKVNLRFLLERNQIIRSHLYYANARESCREWNFRKLFDFGFHSSILH